jgi:ferrous iron transport protein B
VNDQTLSAPEEILSTAKNLRWKIGGNVHETLVEGIYTDAARIADRAVTRPGESPKFDLYRTIDRIVTSRRWGFPLMILLFTIVFWITITGANYPSKLIASVLLDKVYPFLREVAANIGMPWWLSGVLIDGMYLASAWVISVMLPPMAIFFPLFTLLEDFGYLPRVAFNLDKVFKKSGAHGKQALSMMMGFGCNAAGVIATRIIDSPRERLIAIITNNFALCNGRWPTQILVATIFVGALVPPYLGGLISALAVVGIAVLGILFTFLVITINGISIAEHLVRFLDPFAILLGLNGVILVAYIVAIPANEIVIPTILMLTVLITGMHGIGEGAGVMFELESEAGTLAILTAGGWTLLTGINLMLFSLVHNPCSTTLYTIYKETGSLKWTVVSALLPVGMGVVLTFFVAQIWRLVEALI